MKSVLEDVQKNIKETTIEE